MYHYRLFFPHVPNDDERRPFRPTPIGPRFERRVHHLATPRRGGSEARRV